MSIPKCPQCGELVLDPVFVGEACEFFEEDDKVPYFCSGLCALQWIEEKYNEQSAHANEQRGDSNDD